MGETVDILNPARVGVVTPLLETAITPYQLRKGSRGGNTVDPLVSGLSPLAYLLMRQRIP